MGRPDVKNNRKMPKLFHIFLFLSFMYIEIEANIFIDGIYCGQHNCYEILGVTRQSTKSEISKAYRALAKKHHPDKHRNKEDKAEAEDMFKKIANAYEILRDEESRTDYDYMLDHPDEFYSHYYRYYSRRMAPKIDVRVVIVIFIAIISIIQYFVAQSRYKDAISYVSTITKYRNKALEMAIEEGLYDPDKKVRGKSKSDLKAEKEAAIVKILETNMDIRGGYAKPSIADILAIQLLLLPYTVYKYFAWHIRWIYKFNIQRQEYGEEEKYYLIRKRLKYSQTQFDAMTDEEKRDYFKQELWNEEKFEVWKARQEEEWKRKMAENNRHKQYRRLLKQHGTGRITFDE